MLPNSEKILLHYYTIIGRARDWCLREAQVFSSHGREHEGAREERVDYGAVRTCNRVEQTEE